MRTIEKKVWIQYFQKILSGEKTYELRLNDFACEPGDVLILKEWDPNTNQYTGREIKKTVGFVVRTNEIPAFWSEEEIKKHGYQVISLLDKGTSS